MRERFNITKLAPMTGSIACLLTFLSACMTRDQDVSSLNRSTSLEQQQGGGDNPNQPGAIKKALSPVVRIGPCIGAKIADQLFLFAAPCLYSGATFKLQMDFVPGVKTILQTNDGQALSVTIVQTAPIGDFDPMVSREELRILANPRAIFGSVPRLDQDLVAHLDLKDQAEPKMINLALVRIFEKTGSVPLALLKSDFYDFNRMVMVSSFRCQHTGSTHSLTSQTKPEEHPEWTTADSVVNDPARILSPLKTLVLVDGAEAAFPKVATVEPLCLGQNGSPIMTMTSEGYRLLGLGFARIRGILVGARVDGPMHIKIIKAMSTISKTPPPVQNPTALSLSCTQVLSLLSDNSSREYQFENLTFSVKKDGSTVGADDAFILKIDPHDRPHYKVTLSLVEYCTTVRNICYVGVYRDPVNGGVQVFKLEVEGTTPSLAHWVSAEGGAKTTPLEATSCSLTKAPRRDTL